MGFPSADHFRDAISQSQWLEWQAWFNIRGPFGPARDDFWWPQLLLRTGQYDKSVKAKDLYPPWLKTTDVARPPTSAFLRPWDELEEEDEDEEHENDED